MPVFVMLVGNVGAFGLAVYFTWTLFAEHRVGSGVMYAVLALAVLLASPMLINNLFFSSKGRNGERSYLNPPPKV